MTYGLLGIPIHLLHVSGVIASSVHTVRITTLSCSGDHFFTGEVFIAWDVNAWILVEEVGGFQ